MTLLLFAADKPEIANAVLSALRLHMADAMNIPREGHALLWVVNFPMFRYDEDEKKYAAEHHPFTHVLKEDLGKSRFESYTSEIGMVLAGISHIRRHLARWMKPRAKIRARAAVPRPQHCGAGALRLRVHSGPL